MENSTKKGLIFGGLGVIIVGFQPIVANARPQSLDAFIFAAMTCLVEAIMFFPLMMMEIKRKKSNNNIKEIVSKTTVWQNWKKNIWLLILIGSIFGLNQLLFFIGYNLAGAINGSLTQKTSVFFGLIFGVLILKERITKTQAIFSVILFFGLFIAITQGSFTTVYDMDIITGVLILLFITFLWMLGHTMTKSMFDRNEMTPTQMVFIRNIISGIILLTIYLIIFPVENLNVFNDPVNLFFFIAMGVVYGSGLFCWYKTLSYLDVSKATIIIAPTPIVTSLFASFLLGELFTIFHLIGISLVIISIIMIVRQKEISKVQ
ncbi:MAG: EamA family transporter [Candidatus Lokiarchaeota archaeon]|nr:EamA family transporter [Candidatus Lokiarchaeota archaeon]